MATTIARGLFSFVNTSAHRAEIAQRKKELAECRATLRSVAAAAAAGEISARDVQLRVSKKVQYLEEQL